MGKGIGKGLEVEIGVMGAVMRGEEVAGRRAWWGRRVHLPKTYLIFNKVYRQKYIDTEYCSM